MMLKVGANAVGGAWNVSARQSEGRQIRLARRMLLALALFGCGVAAAGDANWAGSTEVFLGRWNSHVTEVYHVSGFHKDNLGKLTGDLPGASIYAVDTMYLLSTRDPQMFEAMCTHTVQAALGLSLDEAHPLVAGALSEARASEIGDYGMVVFQGYRVSVATAAAGQEFVCTVRQLERG